MGFVASAYGAVIGGGTGIEGSSVSATGKIMRVEGLEGGEGGSLVEGDADGTWVAILCW